MHFQIRMYSKSFTEAIHYPSVLGSFHTCVLVHVPTVVDWVKALGSMFLFLWSDFTEPFTHSKHSFELPLLYFMLRAMFLSLKAVSQKHCDLSRCISANSSQALSCVSLKNGVFWSPVSPRCPILFRKQKSYYFSIFCYFGSVSGFWPYTKTLGRVP